MTEQHPPLTDIKQHSHQLLDQLPSEMLPEISLLLEQLTKIINTSVVNHSVPSPSNQSPLLTEQPWLKCTAILKDSPNWNDFLEAIAENRREENEVI